VKRTISIAFGAIAVLTLLGGCSYIRSKFGTGKNEAYRDSTQTRPLEIPPDLDAPNRSGTLVIPEPGAANSAGPVDTSAPDAGIIPNAAPPLAAAASVGGDGLQVADTLANTWRRVGLALERSGVASIQSSDESTRSYDIRTTGVTTRSPGWLKRAVTLGMARDKKVSTPVNLRVRVSGTDGASSVLIEGAATASEMNAARLVLDALRQRMT
jgi:uncharacterized lipoprotein